MPLSETLRPHQYESGEGPDGFYENEHHFECSLHEISKPDDCYDAVVLTQILEHVRSPLNVLEEINRILKQDAKLHIGVPLNGLPWYFFSSLILA